MKVSRLDVNKETGLNDIPPCGLRSCHGDLGPILASAFNLLCHKGVLLDRLKLGYVVPIYKSGSNSAVINYKPIVIKSVITKVLEGLLLNMLSFCLQSYLVQPAWVLVWSVDSNKRDFVPRLCCKGILKKPSGGLPDARLLEGV